MKRLNTVTVIVLALTLGGVVGSLSISYAIENGFFSPKDYRINNDGQLVSSENNEIITEENFDPSKVYKVNKQGQSYGSALYAPSFETEPDLILAEGVDGTIGYVYATDLYGEEPKNPQEALELQKKSSGKPPRTIPLYASDGKTIIGKFKMSSTQRVNKYSEKNINSTDTP